MTIIIINNYVIKIMSMNLDHGIINISSNSESARYKVWIKIPMERGWIDRVKFSIRKYKS